MRRFWAWAWIVGCVLATGCASTILDQRMTKAEDDRDQLKANYLKACLAPPAPTWCGPCQYALDNLIDEIITAKAAVGSTANGDLLQDTLKRLDDKALAECR